MAKAFGGLGVTVGLAADRAALTGVVAGQEFFETDTGNLYIYNGSIWRLISSNTVTTGGVVQTVNTTNNTATSHTGTTYAIYANLTTNITLSGNTRVLVFCNIAAIQTNSGLKFVIAKVDYDNTNTSNADSTNIVAGAAHEWYNSGYGINTMYMNGLTPVLSAGVHTFRVKLRCYTADTFQWNYHGFVEQRSSLTLMEVVS